MPTEMKLKTVMKGLNFHNVKDGRILENMKEEIQTQLVAWERVLNCLTLYPKASKCYYG